LVVSFDPDGLHFSTFLKDVLAPHQRIMYQARVAGLAQLVEHLICNQRVGSSSLSTGTSFPLYINALWRFLQPDKKTFVTIC
jgi:hypothetical protein